MEGYGGAAAWWAQTWWYFEPPEFRSGYEAGLAVELTSVSQTFGKARIIAQQDIGNISLCAGNISGDVLISAGVSPRVDGVDHVFAEPEVLFPDDPGDIELVTSDWTFHFPNESQVAIFDGSIGAITLDTGGIYANGDQDIMISATNMIGDISLGCDLPINGHMVAEDQDIIFQAGGGFGTVFVAGDMDATSGGDIRFVGGDAGMEGMYVGGDMDGDTIDINLLGALAAVAPGDLPCDVSFTCESLAGAVLVGGSILNAVSIQAAAIADVTVGIKGTGNIDPNGRTITFRAKGASGDVGNITVRDILGGPHTGTVEIISEDGAVGDLVAGQIAQVATVNVVAETAIGDIVALDDAEEGIGNLHLEVNSPFGSIGDIISHGDIDAADVTNLIDIDNFDGSIGDVVSLAGSVTFAGTSANPIIFGGSMGTSLPARR
jgi:hypothetical protein